MKQNRYASYSHIHLDWFYILYVQSCSQIEDCVPELQSISFYSIQLKIENENILKIFQSFSLFNNLSIIIKLKEFENIMHHEIIWSH